MTGWKKPPINTNRKYPEGDWRKMCSQAAGYYLKLKEQTMLVNRGGVMIEIVKTGQVHVPCIPLGHLDEYGVGVLDTMLEGNYSIMEIVEFFLNYEPTPGMVFNKKKFAEENPPPPTPPDTEDEEEEEEEPVDEGDGNDGEVEPKPEEPKPKKKKKKKEKKKTPEPEEPKAYEFSLNDPDFMKIPFMHPDKKKTNPTFEEWFKILYSICDPKGLTDEQCIEVMGIRFGGSYKEELNQLKKEGRDLEYIELWFLRKDLEGRAFQDKKYELVRSSLKDKWGVHVSFSKSDEWGLHLVIDKVKENSPAWKGGLRTFDCIVSVHGWVITLFDKAEVALSLLQACGNMAILTILQSHGTTEELSDLTCDSWV